MQRSSNTSFCLMKRTHAALAILSIGELSVLVIFSVDGLMQYSMLAVLCPLQKHSFSARMAC